MSAFNVGGPSEISVGTGAEGVAQYLGWTESSVKVSVAGEFDDVFADYGGSKIPVDVQFHGVQAFVTADIVRWNEGVMNALMAKAIGNTEGTIGGNMIGGMMIGQGLAHQLWIVRPYSSLPAYSGQNAGYHFHAAYPIDAWEIETGTKYSRVRVIWRCLPAWNGAANAVIYDHDISLAASAS